MIIPEVIDRREDNDFEDWLTASLIGNTNQQGGPDDRSSSPGYTDLWMLEITQRNGRIWSGSFGSKPVRKRETVPRMPGR